MEKEIKILGDGSIVKLNDDGSVSIVGNIKKKNANTNNNGNSIKSILYVLLAAAIFIIIFLCFALSQIEARLDESVQWNVVLQDSLKISEGEILVLENRLAKLRTDLEDAKLEALLTQVKNLGAANIDANGNIETKKSLPISIYNVNVHEPIPSRFGGRIEDDGYYYCVINYYSPRTEFITIDVKFYDSIGNLIKNSNSSSDYSYSFGEQVSKGYNTIINSIKAKTKSQLKEGRSYKVEFWINGNIAYSKEFIVYKKKLPFDVMVNGQ